MSRELVEYVKSHVEEDLDINQKAFEKDYSLELKAVLRAFLSTPYDSRDGQIALTAVMCISELEEMAAIRTGVRPTFHETVKCGLAINTLKKENDVEGLVDLRAYVDGDLGRHCCVK